MPAPTIFAQLCDLVDELQRLTRDIEHSSLAYRLEVLTHRFDALIDETIGLEGAKIEVAQEECPE